MGAKHQHKTVKFGPFSYHTWTVRMNTLAHEGRSVWEHCPIPRGTPIQLSIQNLPAMLVTIGQSANRRSEPNSTPPGSQANGTFGWVNKSIVRTGVFPPDKSLLTVGCELHVIPSWQLQLIQQVTALPAPTNASLEGVDVRPLQGHEVDRLQIWAAVTPGSGDLIQVQPWLRHPSGIWAECAPNPAGGPAPVVSSRVLDIAVRDADRAYVSFSFSGVPSGSPVFIAYGILTAPNEAATRGQVHIRFGGVVAPYQ